MKIRVYTDGACSGNPGPGGWAFCMRTSAGTRHEKSGGEINTTNNRMELKAVVESLKFIKAKFGKYMISIAIYSDSTYVVNAIKLGWLHFWKNNNWCTKEKKPIKNQELWQELDELLQNESFDISFVKVKGHAGDRHNEYVDLLAKSAVQSIKRGIKK